MKTLSQFNAILSREMRSYFLSPMFYIISIAFLIMNGLVFAVILAALQQPDAPHGAVMKSFLGGNEFVVIYIMFIVPVITMRSFSEEMSQGTIELLMTVPVSEKTVVMAKYVAASLVYTILWVPTIVYPLILSFFTSLDTGPLYTGYAGLISLGWMFTSVGIFFSLWSRNQIVAAITTVMVLFALFGAGLGEYTFGAGVAKEVAAYINIWSHLESFSQGILNGNALLYYASVTFLFLALSLQRAEARQWR